jgi:hypothetical protein
MSNEGALASLDVDAALNEIASGVLSKEIAARYGVTPFGLRKRLAKHPEYKDAIAEQAHAFVESAMSELMSDELAHDAVAIARARAKVDGALRYAKAHNAAYADKQGVGDLQITVMVARDGQAIRVERVANTPTIEHVAVRLPDNAQSDDGSKA